MRHALRNGVALALAAALSFAQSASAHGEPVIRVEPAVAAAGGSITVYGTEMEAGEIFVLSLIGPMDSLPLGEATAVSEGDESGFVVTLTLPSDLAPGSYSVQARTEAGETAETDLTVTPAGSGPSVEAAPPSADPYPVDRRKPAGQVAGVATAAAASLAVGLWLIRRK